MYGCNEMSLNEATMREIVQYYFTNKMFATGEAPTVKAVGYSGTDRAFCIKLEKQKEGQSEAT